MADLVVISSNIIRPENHSDDEEESIKIHLTPWDLNALQIEYLQRGLLYPKPDPNTQIISLLKSSLSLTLNIFYPFAGRLVKIDNDDEEKTVSFYVDCNGSGVKFVHALSKSVSVSDFLDPVNGFLNRFFPANGVKSCDGVTEPLIAFQVTELRDGVFIGCVYNHMVADGTSFWNFVNTWSEICNSDHHRREFPPLLLRGWFLDGIDYPIRIPISEIETSNRILDVATTTCDDGLQEKLFRFTPRNILDLKLRANGEQVNSDDRKISSLQAILAHMWRSILRNSDLGPNELTHCRLSMDMRQRLNPRLGKECFGNVVEFATTTTTIRELLSNGLGWAALQINKTVGSQKRNEELKVYAENWVKKPELPNFAGMSYNSIVLTSSPRFNVYGNDFGWGKPIAVRVGTAIRNHGVLMAFPGSEDGNIEIRMCLLSRVLEKLLIDDEFLKNVYLV